MKRWVKRRIRKIATEYSVSNNSVRSVYNWFKIRFRAVPSKDGDRGDQRRSHIFAYLASMDVNKVHSGMLSLSWPDRLAVINKSAALAEESEVFGEPSVAHHHYRPRKKKAKDGEKTQASQPVSAESAADA